MKKTKIVATMSDFRCTEEFVKNLFDAGMDVVRVNSAHVSEEGATHIVETVHRVNPAIPIMIDTKGPEIRVTTIADEYGNSINFRPGDRVAVRGSDGSDKTTRKVVYMNVPNIVDDIPVGARMLIADGELEIRVVEKTAEELICDLSDLFKVFGDTTRMRILYSLFESELCVCAIAELLGMTQSAISHQLKVLRDNKLVASRREGKTIYYFLADDHVRTIIGQGFDHLTEHDHPKTHPHNHKED